MEPDEGILRQSASPSRPLRCPAPKGFRPAQSVDWAHPVEDPPAYLVRPRRYVGRRAQGVRYERRVHERLAELAGPSYLPSQWFRFSDCGDLRWCQTDGLMLDVLSGVATIIEVKYQHTADAWFQLRELYLPVVAAVLGPAWRVAMLEVVKWYDPATFFPECPVLCADPRQAPLGRIGVHIWAP